MFSIPSSFKGNNEDYITLPVIKKFLKEYDISPLSGTRDELLENIEHYAQEDHTKQELVMNWIDTIIQEGIREIYLYKFQIASETKILLSNLESAQKHINVFVDKGLNGHICGNNYNDKLTLVKANAETIGSEIKLIFIFCKKLINYDSKQNKSKPIDYPIIAEYYVNSEWLIIKAKPKSNLYKYVENFDLNSAETTKYEKQIDEVRNWLERKLDFVQYDRLMVEQHLKRKIFELVDKFTYTPESIKTIVDNNESFISSISDEIKAIANVPNTRLDDIKSDVSNIIEKYISIYWKNKEDFIKDRDAYPIRLCATDDEESKVEQEAAASQPLQTKAIFFDNKKMLYKNQTCDGVQFYWKRKDKNYFSEYFNVGFRIYKGKCIIKFPEYTEMEDIQDVLFSIIGVGQTN